MCFLVVYHGDGCVSNVGKVVKAGPQLLSLGDGCGTIGHAAHEIGHTLGFFHTQARYDRDQFITVYKDLMQSGWDDQFTPQTKEANNNYDLTYDYGSVMHYGSRSLSKDKKRPAVVAKDGNYTKTLGSDIIAFYDLLMMNMLYKCTDGCGRVLEAKGDWQEFEDNLDGRGANTERDGYKRCNYWIKAPPGKEIEVKIVKLPENADVDGCKHAGVEIKAHSDPRRTGYRFCSEEDINVTLTSNASIVPVITYNREDRIALTKLAYHYV
ncbi:astacin [Teladorsagia circumcincta]|uniref:Metalloendopeptidase n=1 Tax=Teladorsagia circumcincta TaxID=45464 RepID=A0A2G9TWD4_TELCI|nr:astacin [Teladorsagia circumcincta]